MSELFFDQFSAAEMFYNEQTESIEIRIRTEDYNKILSSYGADTFHAEGEFETSYNVKVRSSLDVAGVSVTTVILGPQLLEGYMKIAGVIEDPLLVGWKTGLGRASGTQIVLSGGINYLKYKEGQISGLHAGMSTLFDLGTGWLIGSVLSTVAAGVTASTMAPATIIALGVAGLGMLVASSYYSLSGQQDAHIRALDESLKTIWDTSFEQVLYNLERNIAQVNGFDALYKNEAEKSDKENGINGGLMASFIQVYSYA